MTYIAQARAALMRDEDVRLKLYKCTAGKWTIGAGRNLEDRGISWDEAMYMLENDLKSAEADARAVFPSFDRLTDQRKAVLINMAHNLGRDRLAGFKRMRAAVEAGAWEQAAAEMLDSAWRHQVKDRALRLAEQMRTG